MENTLAVYVSSFDGCSDLWDTFFMMLDKYWPDCDYNIYLVNNEKPFSHNKTKVINTGPEINWFNRTLKSLASINEKYIIFMLEDYFISKTINNEDIDEIIHFMDINYAYYYQLSKGNTKSKDKVRTSVSSKTEYPVSLQPAIWERQVLIEILKEIDGDTPWDVENYFINKYEKSNEIIPGVYHDTRDLLGYKNGVLRGKWIPATLKYYKNLGIDIDTGNREVMSNHKMRKYKLAVFFHKKMPKSIKRVGKKILKVFHFDYLR